MPHYADGTEAKVGDTVHGRLYNTPGVRVGKIISITPGQSGHRRRSRRSISAAPTWPSGHTPS